MADRGDDPRLTACLAEADADPARWFDEPQAVVESGGTYLERLSVLHRWRAVAGKTGDEALGKAVDESILALEQGAATGTDEPEEAPPAWGYGVQRGDE